MTVGMTFRSRIYPSSKNKHPTGTDRGRQVRSERGQVNRFPRHQSIRFPRQINPNPFDDRLNLGADSFRVHNFIQGLEK